MSSTLAPDLRAFVEGEVGTIRRCDRSPGGASRVTWLIDADQGKCVLRVDAGDGPVANTSLTLAREASVYRALADTTVRIPRLIASRPDAVLMEMARGRPDLDGLSETQRAHIIDDYVDALADLHRIECGPQFDALDPPRDRRDAASAQLDLWEGIYRSRVERASPLAELATRWLRAHAPRDAERLVVCHGDVGPGNFLHDDEHVTALLDWEFVHVGDPMDDLAWLAFRGHHFGGGIGDFDAQLGRWQARTGYEVDRRRIAYYRIGVMYIWLISCLAALDNGAKTLDRFTYISLITLMNVILPRAILEFEGRVVPNVPIELAATEGELAENLAALVDLMALTWPATDAGRAKVEPMARQILSLSRLAPAIEREKRAAIGALIGPIDDDDVDRQFLKWIAANPTRTNDALEVVYGNGLRRIQADGLTRMIAAKPFLALG